MSIAPTTQAWCSTKLAWPRWAQLNRCIASAFDVDDDAEEDGSLEVEEEEVSSAAAAAICSGEAYA